MRSALGVVIGAALVAGVGVLASRAKERRGSLPRRAKTPEALCPPSLPEGWTRYRGPVSEAMRTAAELVLRQQPMLGTLQTIAIDGREFGAFVECHDDHRGVSLLIRAEGALRTFPVAAEGRPTFSDTFGAARSGGRTHEGTDIFAPMGTPVVAVDDGTMKTGSGKLSGNFVELRAQDGTRYLYAHLSAFATGPRRAGSRVNAGDVLGFVGDTGNAKGLPPHLHFEIRPPGGTAINPFPRLEAVAVS